MIQKPHIAWEWINGDGGGGLPVGRHAKVASQTEDGVAHISYIYLMNTYITTYKVINTKLIGWVPSPPARRGFCWFLSLEP